MNDPQAKVVRYVEDASEAKGATAGSSCANCGLYQGTSGSPQGPCQLFPGKDVKAKGWCTSWAPQM
ncbi:MAG: high-potential iron-sulfur protein [Steroidobacteraceae bacterium]